MLKCDPRAFAQCPDRKYCEPCATDACFMEGSECDKFNQSVLGKPQTNADWIRAMSVEELERFLDGEEWICNTYKDCCACPLYVNNGCLTTGEWLSKPAKEEHYG